MTEITFVKTRHHTGNLAEMMRLQADIRFAFLKLGADEDLSFNLAAEALHIFATSKLIKTRYMAIYHSIARD